MSVTKKSVQIRKLKNALSEYFMNEFSESESVAYARVDYINEYTECIHLAHTTIGDEEEVGVQVNLNVNKLYVEKICYGKMGDYRNYYHFSNLDEMTSFIAASHFESLAFDFEKSLDSIVAFLSE